MPLVWDVEHHGECHGEQGSYNRNIHNNFKRMLLLLQKGNKRKFVDELSEGLK